MRRIRFLASIFLIVAACDTSMGPSSDSTFSYRAYDAEGTAVAEGWFCLVEEDSVNSSGQWHIAALGNPENIGPQIGYGALVASINADTLHVELNPQFVDNNVTLRGILQGTSCTGQWSWATFAGITNHGPFEATLR